MGANHYRSETAKSVQFLLPHKVTWQTKIVLSLTLIPLTLYLLKC